MVENGQFTSDRWPQPLGLMALIEVLDLKVSLPGVRSYLVRGARATKREAEFILEQYPPSYAPAGLIGHLRFALRYEPIDLGVWLAIFQKLGLKPLEKWIRAEPTGIFARRAWYLYELLLDERLDVPDVAATGYVDLLNPALHFTGARRLVSRQRIYDNLLGGRDYCPLIRRTETLAQFLQAGLQKEAEKLMAATDPALLLRAAHYLYTKETKSSFAIEGEQISANRSERFVAALQRAAAFESGDHEAFIRLQNKIVEARYAETNWRTAQNFVGETMRDYTEQVHFVCPKPEDVKALMAGWQALARRLHDDGVDAVCAAAAAAFGFVFIHPFEDGNGRIHRFLVHHVLARAGYTPAGMLFPVSAAMLRDSLGYERALRSFSGPRLPLLDYWFDAQGYLKVRGETAHLYRYWDATECAEYLYRCVADTLKVDIKEELRFLQEFDAALAAVSRVVDMPPRRATLLVKLLRQNEGRLSQTKRGQFLELSDEEVAALENAVAASGPPFRA